MRGIRGENARPGVSAIRTQCRESRNSEEDELRLDFWIADMVDRVGRKKVKQFSAPGLKTSSIPLKNPERVRERRGRRRRRAARSKRRW